MLCTHEFAAAHAQVFMQGFFNAGNMHGSQSKSNLPDWWVRHEMVIQHAKRRCYLKSAMLLFRFRKGCNKKLML